MLVNPLGLQVFFCFICDSGINVVTLEEEKTKHILILC